MERFAIEQNEKIGNLRTQIEQMSASLSLADKMVRELEAKLQENSDFHTKLQANDASLNLKLKEMEEKMNTTFHEMNARFMLTLQTVQMIIENSKQ